ncbi:MAG: long-chain-fatty-acid--CoA ligase [Streptosporangiales bacterium]|nr:long-chain-fatty-acid--CoA ligase [Streptosporangiales bacterium]
MLISDLLRYAAVRAPEATALRFEDLSWTYRELYERTCRLANALRGIARPGDRVAILAENHPEYVLAYYGVPLAGMALTFLNYRLNAREITGILADARPTVVITEAAYLPVIEEARATVDSVHTVVMIDADAPDTVRFGALVDAAPAEQPEADDDALAWLIYTSGTTGRPKGAMLSHRNVTAAVANTTSTWEHGGDDVVTLFPWPLCHIAGYSVLVSHTRAAELVVMRRYDPESFLELVERHRVTDITGAPTMLSMLLRTPGIETYDTSTIRRIGYGAAPMPVEVLRKAMERFPNARFQTGFGMTELSGNVMFHTADDHVAAVNGRTDLLASVGKPMPLSAIRVVDAEDKDVPVDEVGELVIRGDQVTMGYWGMSDATAEAMRGGWFHSGDLAKLDADGYLYIVDRLKDMILTGGENVYSREVEDVLYAHPGVAEAAVIGEPDEVWGERVVAVIQPSAAGPPAEEELIALCTERLAGFKRPRRFILLDELPRNAAGKILKRELRDTALRKAPPGA